MNKDLNILAVNLDGTLVKSDMLLETFWSAFSKDISYKAGETNRSNLAATSTNTLDLIISISASIKNMTMVMADKIHKVSRLLFPTALS